MEIVDNRKLVKPVPILLKSLQRIQAFLWKWISLLEKMQNNCFEDWLSLHGLLQRKKIWMKVCCPQCKVAVVISHQKNSFAWLYKSFPPVLPVSLASLLAGVGIVTCFTPLGGIFASIWANVGSSGERTKTKTSWSLRETKLNCTEEALLLSTKPKMNLCPLCSSKAAMHSNFMNLKIIPLHSGWNCSSLSVLLNFNTKWDFLKLQMNTNSRTQEGFSDAQRVPASSE